LTVPPALRAVAAAFAELFIVDDGPYVLRRSTVSRAVAALLGVPWSPHLGQRVTAIVLAAGGRAAILRVPVFTWVRPLALPRAESARRALALRRQLRRSLPDPELLAEARRVLGNA
jgi:hypothetical protein